MTLAEMTIRRFPEAVEKFEKLSPYGKAVTLKLLEEGLTKLCVSVEELQGGCTLYRPKFR